MQACLYSETIPSKTLREAIVNLMDFNNRSFYAKDRPIQEVTISDLNYRLSKVIEEEKNMVLRQFRKNNIRYSGRFTRTCTCKTSALYLMWYFFPQLVQESDNVEFIEFLNTMAEITSPLAPSMMQKGAYELYTWPFIESKTQ